MKDLQKMLGGLSKSGFMSGMAGGALSGVVTNLAMGKKSKKMGKSALKVGALAAVGGLAWKAYQSYSQQKSSGQNSRQANDPSYYYTPQRQSNSEQHTYSRPEPRTFDYGRVSENRFDEIIEDESADGGQMLLMQAMIAAAYADGHIDNDEQARIFNQVEQMELSTAEKASLFDELRRPKSMEQIVARVPDAETGVEVYAASLLAIDERMSVSEQYLDNLAKHLCIPRELKAAIHQQAHQARLQAS